MGVSKDRGKTSKSSILIGFFIINHPFWGTPIFGIFPKNDEFQSCVPGRHPLNEWLTPARHFLCFAAAWHQHQHGLVQGPSDVGEGPNGKVVEEGEEYTM